MPSWCPICACPAHTPSRVRNFFAAMASSRQSACTHAGSASSAQPWNVKGQRQSLNSPFFRFPNSPPCLPFRKATGSARAAMSGCDAAVLLISRACLSQCSWPNSILLFFVTLSLCHHHPPLPPPPPPPPRPPTLPSRPAKPNSRRTSALSASTPCSSKAHTPNTTAVRCVLRAATISPLSRPCSTAPALRSFKLHRPERDVDLLQKREECKVLRAQVRKLTKRRDALDNKLEVRSFFQHCRNTSLFPLSWSSSPVPPSPPPAQVLLSRLDMTAQELKQV